MPGRSMDIYLVGQRDNLLLSLSNKELFLFTVANIAQNLLEEQAPDAMAAANQMLTYL